LRALYEKTIGFILQYIDEQGLKTGDQLPPESRLATQAGVSLVTVRRALAELAAQAVVRREQGRGTFVVRPRVRAETTRVGGLRNSLHLDARSSLKTRVLGCFSRRANAEEVAALGLQEGAAVWEISRLRLLSQRPVIWERSVIPKLLAPDLGSYFERRDRRSLYELLDDVYDLKEAREEQMLVSRPALPREVELLELLNFEWVVEIVGVSLSTRHTPIDRFRMVFVAKSFAFRLATAPTHAVEAVEITAPQPSQPVAAR
jgi:DNA-binding GntR family transcriptional regulator